MRGSISESKHDKAKRQGRFMKGLKRNQLWEYLKKSVVKTGVRHEEAYKEDRQQKQMKMAKVSNCIGSGFKQRKQMKGLLLHLLTRLGFVLHGVLFCCFVFVRLLVLMRQQNTVAESMGYVQDAWLQARLCHLPAEEALGANYLISLCLIFLINK